MKRKKMSNETKMKISSALKGRKHSDEWNKKIGDSNRGKKRTKEVRLNMSKSRFKHGLTYDGYKRIMSNDGRRIKEHRYMMEQKLGRRLNSKEIVHHINKDKLDNRIENLILTTSSEHNRQHALENGLGKNNIGKTPWNKGLTKMDNPNVKGGRPFGSKDECKRVRRYKVKPND